MPTSDVGPVPRQCSRALQAELLPGPGIMALGSAAAPLGCSLCSPSLHAGFLGMFSHTVGHTINGSQVHTSQAPLPREAGVSLLYLSVSVPSLRPSVIPPLLSPEPINNSWGQDHLSRSLPSGRCKASGTRRTGESPPRQGGQERGQSLRQSSGC